MPPGFRAEVALSGNPGGSRYAGSAYWFEEGEIVMYLMRMVVIRPVEDVAEEEKRRTEVADTLGEDYLVVLGSE